MVVFILPQKGTFCQLTDRQLRNIVIGKKKIHKKLGTPPQNMERGKPWRRV